MYAIRSYYAKGQRFMYNPKTRDARITGATRITSYNVCYTKLLRGDEINRSNYVESEGVLNGEDAVKFGNWMQSLVKDKYIDRKPTDDKGFLQGKVAIHYNGSWAVGDMTKAYGDDLAIMPVPDFGHGPVIGGGSWHWGISKACPNKEGAAQWLSFLITPEEIAAMSNATSLIPNTQAAADMTENYKVGGKWRVFYEYSKAFAKMRPETPAYSYNFV